MNKDLFKLYKFLKGAGLSFESGGVNSLIKICGMSDSELRERENFIFLRTSIGYINYDAVDFELVKKSYLKVIDPVIEFAKGAKLSGDKNRQSFYKMINQYSRNFADSVRAYSRDYFAENFPGMENSWDSAALFRIMVLHTIKSSEYFSDPDKKLDFLDYICSIVKNVKEITAEDFKNTLSNYKYDARKSVVDNWLHSGKISEYDHGVEMLHHDLDYGKISNKDFYERRDELRKQHGIVIPESEYSDDDSEE